MYKHFDVIINETKCDETVNDSEIVLPGYDLLGCNRSRNGGGVVLYISFECCIMVLILNDVMIYVTKVLSVFGLN